MKKKNIFLVIILVFCIFMLVFITISIIYNNKLNHISKILNLDVGNCELVNSVNTHDGFLGDGEYFSKLKCSSKEDDEIKLKWEKLPMNEELQKAMDYKLCSDLGCSNFFERYNVQIIENGYYYFYDRHLDAKDNKNDLNLNNRSSYNFSVGLFDSDSKMLYFYELDT